MIRKVTLPIFKIRMWHSPDYSWTRREPLVYGGWQCQHWQNHFEWSGFTFFVAYRWQWSCGDHLRTGWQYLVRRVHRQKDRQNHPKWNIDRVSNPRLGGDSGWDRLRIGRQSLIC